MSSWFDRLLEELQRRQQEADARREGRPLPPRRDASRDRYPGPTPGVGDDGPDTTNGEPTPLRGRRPAGPGRGGPPFGGPWANTDWGDWRRYRRWIYIGLGLVLVVVLLSLAGGIVNLLTDLQWFSALGLTGVLTTRLWSQVGLFVLGFFAFGIPAVASILVARRIAPRVPVHRVGGVELPDASGLITIGLLGAAVLGALISATAWSSAWDTILLWRNGGTFGVTDAHFGHDIGFYVFGLPFWRFLQGWGVGSLIGIVILTLAAYAGGALRWQFRLSTPVRAHLTILGALLLLVIASGYQLDIAELSFSTRGMGAGLQGASYTDLNAQQPAYVILTVVAVIASLLMLANIWFKTLWLLGFAAAGWIVLSVVVGGIYPGFVQNFQVSPNELARERPQIAANIGATRAAFGIDAVTEKTFTGTQALSRSLFNDNTTTINNMRLWDYRPLLDTINQTKTLRSYYDFGDVDIDRYQVNGKETQVMLSGRELAPTAGQTWTNEHLFFTHGYGIVAVPVNGVTPEGQPDYLVSGINQKEALTVDQPRIYFGEAESSYVVTGTQTTEFDYPVGSDKNATTIWNGKTGVGVGGFFNKLLFALRFGDLNLLISNQLTDSSQILFRRAIAERVRELAPFLSYDRDPYIVSADDRLVWMWDAYTTSSRYPNAQPLQSGIFPGANYVRNSVKVVIDAYDGSIHFYVVDPSEPIIAAYRRIFPSLFEPLSAMPEDLRAHLRYPEDLFSAQNEAYMLYHVPATDAGAATFYNQEDRWAFPTQQTDVEGQGRQIEPYYVIMKIPGEQSAEFALIQPLVAASRPNMVAWVAARMDPGVYGQRISFRFPNDSTTLGPAQIQARINQDSTISAQFTLWSRAGSSVVRGDLLVLPMGDSILYVEPIFLRSTESSFPEFKRVILASQNRIAFAETIDEGLRQILGEAPIPPPVEEPGAGGGAGQLPGDVAGLVAEAQRLYAAAQAALTAGDLGTYQARIDELASVIQRLGELTGASPAPSP
ncbi:MAG: UPF0182 family protein [Chloroflexota bacterium]|nr:UPF0182 family protein [Chloroflexota bacterium]